MADRIIVVDDEREIADLIGLYLENDGYEVHKFLNGADALSFVEKCEPALAVLDVMLPDTDGFALLRKMREKHDFPIIMLTARVTDSDKILGLTIGADDYITKPFNPLEVTARVKTVLRRCRRGAETNDEMDIRGLTINRASRRCSLFGRELSLTPTEFDILRLLMQHAGTVFSPREIYRRVWGDSPVGVENAVAVHIRHLRSKIEIDPTEPRYLKVVWGKGYKMEERRNEKAAR
mgnify:CR=1 FL=1